MNKDIKIAFYTRLIVQLLIFISNINPLTKIILIFLTDVIDSEILKRCYNSTSLTLRTNNQYQFTDKLNDMIGYLLTINIISKYKLLSMSSINILWIVLCYRIIGEIIAYKTKNRKYLMVFIDLYKEIFLLMYFIKDPKIFYILFVILVIFKLYVEYIYHYKPQETLQKIN